MYHFYGELSCKGSSNCLYLDQAVLCARFYLGCAVIRSPQKMAAIMSSGARETQEPQKPFWILRMTSLAAHAQSWGLNIEDDVIYLELKSRLYYSQSLVTQHILTLSAFPQITFHVFCETLNTYQKHFHGWRQRYTFNLKTSSNHNKVYQT